MLLLNPFREFVYWYLNSIFPDAKNDFIGKKRELEEIKIDIKAFEFLKKKATYYAEKGDFTGRLACKYHNTMAFIRNLYDLEIDEFVQNCSERISVAEDAE